MDLNIIKKSLIDKIDVILPLLIFIFTFIVYIKFLAPSIILGDPAEFCIASYTLGIPHPNGYPIYTWIGHIFTLLPIGSIAYRVNLMSAFFGALTVSLIYFIILKIEMNKESNSSLSGSNQNSFFNIYRLIAVVAAFSLAFSVTFWSQSEFAEVYTFNAFFVALMILLLLFWSKKENNRFLYAFFLIYGLSIGAHASNILFLPAFLIYILLINYKTFLSTKNSLLFILLFIIGISQFLYILIRVSQYPTYSYISPGFNEWLYLIMAKQYSHYLVFSASEIPQRILMYLNFLKENFLVLGSLFGIIGIIELFRKNIKVFTLFILMFISNTAFYINYHVFDVEMMFIPSFLVFSIFVGMGIISIFEFIKNNADNFKGIISYKDINLDIFSIFIIIFLIISILMPLSFYFINHDNINQNEDRLVNFTYESLKEVPSNSTVITYWYPYTAFKYFQITENINPDVKTVAVDNQNLLNTVNQNIDNKNVFVMHNIFYIDPCYNVTPFFEVPGSGTLYKIKKIV
ncbi:glycosyltransferase family 117 protein [Methanobacterium oryzae]|uniref:glycosyltransferase family 117 protein n=1 Tax=Methanobacterium oryzae TaxID=69540 RepID=UPI003D21E614